MEKLRVLSLFSGIGAYEQALTNLKIQHEVVNYCEIDKYASKCYSLIHNVPESKNLGDVSKVEDKDLPQCDLLTWGFPCTDISVAGKMQGIVKGVTRSGLYYEGLRILRATKPKYSIVENVKNLVSKKFKPQFESMLQDFDECGYNSYISLLNSKDFGVAQNRERVFVISIRKDIDDGSYTTPLGFPLDHRLKDVLESEVDDKYYINNDRAEKLIAQIQKQLLEKTTIAVSNQATKVD